MTGCVETPASREPVSRPAASKRVLVNGEPIETQAITLAELLTEAGYGGAKVATAVNSEFVPERARARHPVAAGDCIEIVAPRQGG